MFDWLKNKKNQNEQDIKKPVVIKRFFNAAAGGNIYGNWNPGDTSLDSEIYKSLPLMRARSREKWRNSSIAKRYSKLLRKNVVGKNGITFQSLVLNSQKKPDQDARSRIEMSFKKFSMQGNCDVTRNYSIIDIQKIVLDSTARDGEFLVWMRRGFKNDFGFALQLLEADHLDHSYNDKLNNGNIIRMGIEKNRFGENIAFYLFPNHPGENAVIKGKRGDHIRVPAADLIHVFMPERVSGSRGFPWISAVINDLHLIDLYREAEIVAARTGAAKNGFYTQPENAPGSKYISDTTQNGSPVSEIEPGINEVLPPGWAYTANDPQHPTTAFPSFLKSLYGSVAAGVDLSYHKLTGDLTEVNYSSGRLGDLDDRDTFRDLQSFLSQHLMDRIFYNWIDHAILSGELSLPISKIEKYLAHDWQSRGWVWVDPEKDAKAKEREINAGFDTATAAAAESGRSLEDVYKQQQSEALLRLKYGVLTPHDLKIMEALGESEK